MQALQNKGTHRTGPPKVNVYANRAWQALGVSTSFTWGEAFVRLLSEYRMYDTPHESHTSLTKPHPAGMATYVTTMTFWLKNPSRVQSGLDFEKQAEEPRLLRWLNLAKPLCRSFWSDLS